MHASIDFEDKPVSELIKFGKAQNGYSFGSPSATLQSFITAFAKKASAGILRRCEEYAKFWNIGDRYIKLQQKLATWEERALKNSDYALVQKQGVTTVRKFAAYDDESTATAAISFHNNRHRYPHAWRQETAVNLLKKAAEYKARLPDFISTYLHKAACLGFPTAASVERILIQRYKPQEETSEKLAQLLTTFINNPDACGDLDLVKEAISVVEQYDQEHGLTAKYGAGIDLPEELIDTSHTVEKLEKLAASTEMVVTLTNGKDVDVTAIPRTVLEAIGVKLAAAPVSELIGMLPKLSEEDANTLVRLL